MRPVPTPEAAPMIACVLALADVQDRAAERRRQDAYEALRRIAATLYGLTAEELIEARQIASRYGYAVSEAIEIVRRSRK